MLSLLVFQLVSCEKEVEVVEVDLNLKSVMVDGVVVDNFNPALTVYQVNVPYGLDVMPVVTAEAVDANAVVEVVNVTAMPGMASITVKGNGSESMSYFVNFIEDAPLSDDANLKSLKVDGVLIDGFSFDKYEYAMELSSEAVLPVISAEAYDKNAIVEITQITEFPGQAIVKVIAEDGEAVENYTIDFTQNQFNTDLLLGNWNLALVEIVETSESGVWFWQFAFNDNGAFVWTDEEGSYDIFWEVTNEDTQEIRIYDDSIPFEFILNVESVDENTLEMIELYEGQHYKYTFERISKSDYVSTKTAADFNGIKRVMK